MLRGNRNGTQECIVKSGAAFRLSIRTHANNFFASKTFGSAALFSQGLI